MKNYKYLLSLVFLIAIGCVKDNTVNDFNVLNEITIKKFNEKYEAKLGERFTLPTDVTMSFGEKSDVRYVWYLYSTQFGVRDTISTDKNLDIVLTGSDAVPGVEYTLVYRITDNKTGIFATENTKFSALSDYTKGTLLLCEEKGEKELNFLLADENKTILDNVFELNNGHKLDNTITQVYFTDPNASKLYMKQVYLLGTSADGGYALDPNSLSTQYTMREMFDNPIAAPTIELRDYSYPAGQIDYIVLNGKLSKRTVNMGNLQFQPEPLFVFSPKTDYRVGAYFAMESEILFYDDLNHRILKHSPFNKGTIVEPDPLTSTATHFNPSDMGDYKFLAGGKIGIDRDKGIQYWMIGQQNVTKAITLFKFYQQIVSGKLSINTVDKVDITAAVAPNIANATTVLGNYAANQGAFKLCFYHTGDKIYSINTETLTSATAGLSETLQIDLSAENMTITGMKFPTVNVPDENSSTGATRKANQIRVYVQDNNLSELKGGVIYYEVTTVGGIALKEVYRKVGGYCDKVIDIEEKTK